MSDSSAVAGRLCRECGFCCNGVLFETVRLRQDDPLKVLASAGMTLKRKNGCLCLMQPCAAWREGGCGIYTERPARCREFECLQIVNLKSGAIAEEDVLHRIKEGKELVAELRKLLFQAGSRNERRPLLKRCEMVLSAPADPDDEQDCALRRALHDGMGRLEELLDRHFRLIPPL